MTEQHLAIGYVHNGSVRAAFMDSVANFIVHDFNERQWLVARIAAQGVDLSRNRNGVVERFLSGSAAEWLLFIDTDQVFDPTVPYRLIDSALAHGAKIMSALVFTYMSDDDLVIGGPARLVPNWFARLESGECRTLQQIQINEVQKIDAAGAGCILIHREVFEAIRRDYSSNAWPFFDHDPYTKGDGKPGRLSEDLTFAARATKLGFQIYGDASIVVGHEKSRIENLETAMAAQRS